MVAAFLLMLPAADPAEAQYRPLSGGSGSVGKGFGKPGIGLGPGRQLRPGSLRSPRLRDRRGRPVFAKRSDSRRFRADKVGSRRFDNRRRRSDRRFRRGYFPAYGYRDRRYYDDEGFEYDEESGRGPEAGADTAAETQPPAIPPVTPKWIRVEVQVPADGSTAGGDAVAQNETGGDCRDGTTQITVNGQPIAAYREDCRGVN